MKTLNLYRYGKQHPISFEINRYVENNNLYVGMVTHEDGFPEPWNNLTVNLGVKCADNCAFIDTNNNGSDIVEWLISNGLGHLTGRIVTSGFCTYPEFVFDMEKIEEHLC